MVPVVPLLCVQHHCVQVVPLLHPMQVGMSRRHKEEALVLFNSQKMSWLVAAEELGWCLTLISMHHMLYLPNNLCVTFCFTASPNR